MQFLILVYVNFAFQHDPLPQQPKSEQLEKLKVFKVMLERLITFLQVSKNNITPTFKEKLGFYEKQIVGFLNPSRYRKPIPNLQQGQLPHPHIQPMQQPQSQVPQLQSHENQLNPQLQSMNMLGSVPKMQQNNMSSLLHNSLSILSEDSTSQSNMMNPIQPGSNLDSGQGNALSLLQQRKIPCNIKFISPWNQGNKYTDNKFTLLFLLKLNFFFKSMSTYNQFVLDNLSIRFITRSLYIYRE